MRTAIWGIYFKNLFRIRLIYFKTVAPNCVRGDGLSKSPVTEQAKNGYRVKNIKSKALNDLGNDGIIILSSLAVKHSAVGGYDFSNCVTPGNVRSSERDD